jgi:lipopolysaccharide transport system ATP-binding protein
VSMQDIIIDVRGASKAYKVYERPSDRLRQFVFGRFGREFGHIHWALRDISFSVRRGETVGIIGRNGSGKSTLLQILAGTLSCTTGDVSVKGRITALLELGSGLNPEFPGRENVFLLGGILGLSMSEIERKFASIAAFADIGEFMNLPVKTYSTGMQLRLAFAVISHLDPEVLIIDEALAVGDMVFQAKCMRRMRDLCDSGKTILFVSHDLHSVKAFCKRTIYLNQGRLVAAGLTEEIVDQYIMDQQREIGAFGVDDASGQSTNRQTVGFVQSAESKRHWIRQGTGEATFVSIAVLDDLGREARAIPFDAQMTVLLEMEAHKPLDNLVIAFYIKDRTQIEVIGNSTFLSEKKLVNISAGRIVTRWTFPNRLKGGEYSVTAIAANQINTTQYFDWVDLGTVFSSFVSEDRRIWSQVHLPMELDVSFNKV